MNKQQINSESQSERVLVRIILLGLNVHADSITEVRQTDGGMPQPAQKFSWAGLLDWMKRPRERAEVVWSCYETDPFGYGLHRQLEQRRSMTIGESAASTLDHINLRIRMPVILVEGSAPQAFVRYNWL